MILDELTVDPTAFASRTGWAATPGGLCKGDLCVPASDITDRDGRLDINGLSNALGMPLVHDADTGIYALGPETLGRSLTTAVAPNLELPEVVDGGLFSLASLVGRKVLLLAWASW